MVINRPSETRSESDAPIRIGGVATVQLSNDDSSINSISISQHKHTMRKLSYTMTVQNLLECHQALLSGAKQAM